MDQSFQQKFIEPENVLAEIVNNFASLQNLPDMGMGIIIPNGKIDMLFSNSNNELSISLVGLETRPKAFPKQYTNSNFFSISFFPLAVESVFHHSIADILDSKKLLSVNFWDFTIDDLNDFDSFCIKAAQKIQMQLSIEMDERKLQLFKLIFKNKGEVSIKELSRTLCWSARQINQYFNQQFGLPLKTYCNILRFQSSLLHIQEGKLFPELNYYDQSHFIKEVKKLSGASPKELFKNPNGRFLQFLHSSKR
jgi:AraC-like DNA-binding protein